MVKLGIIGMGLRATVYADALMGNRDAEIVAVSDINKGRVDEACQKYSCKGYTDYKEMIDSEKLDAVLITTPDSFHKDPVLYAAAHNLDMLIEKPFATTTEDALAMYDVIKQKKLKCIFGFENRWNFPYCAAKAKIDAGEVGDVLNVNCRLNNTIFVPTKMFTWANQSSPAWFLFPHAIDMACWLNGKKVKRVYANGTKKKLVSMGIDTYDSIQAVLTFDDGSTSSFNTTWVLPETRPLVYDFKVEVVGEKACIYIDTQNQMVSFADKDAMYNVHSIGTSVYGRPTSAAHFLISDFVQNLVDGTYPEVNEDVALANTMAVEAVHRSIATGSIIDL